LKPTPLEPLSTLLCLATGIRTGEARALPGTGRRCCPGCFAAASAAGTAWRLAPRPSACAPYGYTCGFYPVNYGTGDRCQHIAGPALDDYVARQVLHAVAPAALEVSMAAAAHAENERGRPRQALAQRVEGGRCAADRARRQYQLAEPENRLTRQLEADRESALAEAGSDSDRVFWWTPRASVIRWLAASACPSMQCA
jgi:hypothetical protein